MSVQRNNRAKGIAKMVKERAKDWKFSLQDG
jgi:hypothetical protein